MKKQNLFYLFAVTCFILFSCRSEDLSSNYQNSNREEEFFREALRKTESFKNGNDIVDALKQQNEKSHFVLKMKDLYGVPVWDKMIAGKKSNLGALNKGNGEEDDDFETLVIPLTENSENLSSILYVTKDSDGTYSFNNYKNIDVKKIVYNTQIDKEFREQLLSSFIIVDHLTFSPNSVYRNIPDDLYSFIPKINNDAQRKFTIQLENYPDTGGTATSNLSAVIDICVIYTVECTRCPDNDGSHDVTVYNCTPTYTGGGGGGNTDNGGSGGDGGSTGGGDPNGGGGPPTTECGGENRPFYRTVPCDGEEGTIQALETKMLYYGYTVSDYHDILSGNSGIAEMYNSFLTANNNAKGAAIILTSLKFLSENSDTLKPLQLPSRIYELDNALIQNPNLLLDIPCTELPQWQAVATHQVPMSVISKMANIKNQTNYYNNWELTDLEDGLGTKLNMDLFPVKITTMPFKPNSTTVRYTHEEFFDFFRKNINLFAETFTPIEDNYYNIHETALWNSANPLGALIHINIPLDDGTVVCSGYWTNSWMFTTVKAPLDWYHDGVHPVAGNRLFSYYTNPDGSINIYTRGVDRVSHNYSDNSTVLNYLMQSLAFEGADQLWEGMQQKLKNYIVNHGGNAIEVTPVKYRPNYTKIANYIKGNSNITTLGCH